MQAKGIIEKYPEIWGKLRYGSFEFGSGWYPLIIEMSEEIRALMEKDESVREAFKSADYIIAKEKFGQLRIQGIVSSNELDKIIDKYERLSVRTCETCGNEGKLKCAGNWYYTSCEEHIHGKEV